MRLENHLSEGKAANKKENRAGQGKPNNSISGRCRGKKERGMRLTTGNETSDLKNAPASIWERIFGFAEHKPKEYPLAPFRPSPFDPMPSRSLDVSGLKDEEIKTDKFGMIEIAPTASEVNIEFVKEGKSGNGRADVLTKYDQAALAKRGLDTDKARKLKPYFSRECSALIASNEIKARGFSERTLDDYWASFHEAEQETGNQPAKARNF